MRRRIGAEFDPLGPPRPNLRTIALTLATDADSTALRFLDSLRRSQWLAPEALRKHQLKLLERLVRHAARHVPFYRDRLKPLFGAADPLDAPIRWDAWADVPLTTRRDAVEQRDALFSRSADPEAAAYVEAATSGSTGEPVWIRRSLYADIASLAAKMRVYEMNGIDVNGSMAIVASPRDESTAYPDGAEALTWNFMSRNAPRRTLDSRTDVADQWRWLCRAWPDYLSTYGPNLRALAEHALHAGEGARSLKCCINVGDALTDATRAAVRTAFGCEAIDLYEASEMGHIAGSCPRCAGLHVSTETMLVEVTGPDGAVLEPGQEGEIRTTALYNYAMPLIRYAVGDWAATAEASPCGRGLQRLDRIRGRTRNMLRLRSGGHIWPVLPFTQLRRWLPFSQAQVVQTAPGHVEIRYVAEPGAAPPDHAGIDAHVATWAPEMLSYELVPVASLGRAEGGKFEDFISLLP